MAGKPIESKEPPKSPFGSLFFWVRVLFSFVILAFSLTVTLAALFEGKTTMWEAVPSWLAVILFFTLMSVVGMLEGMQIAFFYVAKLTKDERGTNSWALSTCDILYNRRGGLNLPGFMIGRQLCVVTCFFVVARVTTQNVGDDDTNVMGLPDWVQNVLNFGFQGALITTILGSITWQLVAAVFPVAFLSNPVTYILLRICLFLEATGICNGAWVLAAIFKGIFGYQKDEVYIGTAEERASRGMKDDSQRDIDMAPLVGFAGVNLPGFKTEAPKSLRELADTDPEVGAYINKIAGSSSGANQAAAPAPSAQNDDDDDDDVEVEA